MSTLNIPAPITELITNLSVIGMIDKEQKLNVNTMSFSPSSTWGQSFYRRWYRESRQGLIEFLKHTLAETILAIQDYSNTEFCKIIVNHLSLSRPGIVNLSITYADDPNILSQLKVILESIDIQLTKNKKLIEPDFKSIIIPREERLTRRERERDLYCKDEPLNVLVGSPMIGD